MACVSNHRFGTRAMSRFAPRIPKVPMVPNLPKVPDEVRDEVHGDDDSEYMRIDAIPLHAMFPSQDLSEIINRRVDVMRVFIDVWREDFMKPTRAHRIQLTLEENFASMISTWLPHLRGETVYVDFLDGVIPSTAFAPLLDAVLAMYMGDRAKYHDIFRQNLSHLSPVVRGALMYRMHRWLMPTIPKIHMCMSVIFDWTLRLVLEKEEDCTLTPLIARFAVEHVATFAVDRMRNRLGPVFATLTRGSRLLRVVMVLAMCRYAPADCTMDVKYAVQIADAVSQSSDLDVIDLVDMLVHRRLGIDDKTGTVDIRINTLTPFMFVAVLVLDRVATPRRVMAFVVRVYGTCTCEIEVMMPHCLGFASAEIDGCVGRITGTMESSVDTSGGDTSGGASTSAIAARIDFADAVNSGELTRGDSILTIRWSNPDLIAIACG
jgi:hypothetical protein